MVFVPEAEPVVGDLRLLHDPSAAAGASAHITVLFPFMAPAALTPAVLDRCAAVIASHAAFSFRLDTVGRFPATTYLEPSPAAPFVALTHALWGAFPAFPPFRGEFASVVPHLTVSHGDEASAPRVASQLRERVAKDVTDEDPAAGCAERPKREDVVLVLEHDRLGPDHP